jgi:hypothetical protein
MKCEDFEDLALDRTRGFSTVRVDPRAAEVDSVQAAVLQHASSCPRCAAFQDSWQEARVYLRAVGAATEDASAPRRVEMRLLQEFRIRNRKRRINIGAAILAWSFASAGLLVGGISWWNWHEAGRQSQAFGVSTANGSAEATQSLSAVDENAADASGGGSTEAATLVAANDADQFVLLPGSVQQESGDASVVRVRLQRGALGALGLPVNEDRATEWIQVDLFVGEDGQPQAVRLPQ